MCNKTANKATIAIRPPDEDDDDDTDFVVKFEDRKDFENEEDYKSYNYILEEVMKIIKNIFDISREG